METSWYSLTKLRCHVGGPTSGNRDGFRTRCQRIVYTKFPPRSLPTAAVQHVRVHQLVVETQDGWMRTVRVQKGKHPGMVDCDLVHQAFLRSWQPTRVTQMDLPALVKLLPENLSTRSTQQRHHQRCLQAIFDGDGRADHRTKLLEVPSQTDHGLWPLAQPATHHNHCMLKPQALKS